MDFSRIEGRGLVLLGCGKMGGAMLEGWLAGGLSPRDVTILDPNPAPRLRDLAGAGLRLNAALPDDPAIVVLAVKPQMMGEALPSVAALGNGQTIFVSVAAGTSIARFETILGAQTPIVRAMPNTPAAVGRGITALVANDRTDAGQYDLAETLMKAVGQTVRLEQESQMDAVTAVSGSGPAYVFLLIEAMAAAGAAQGLSPELALQLARATVAGAGHLAENSPESPGQLRMNVTSPGGTTAAALAVLQDKDAGLPDLLARAVDAAAGRSRALAES